MGFSKPMLLGVVILLGAMGEAHAEEGWRLPLEPSAWQAMPHWLSHPSAKAKVGQGKEGLRFFVPEAGRGMKWLAKGRWFNTSRFRYLHLRYRARGLNTTSHDYLLWVNDGGPKGGRTLVRLSELRSDGAWHDLVVDVIERQDLQPYITDVALQVQAVEPDAELVVAEGAFRDTPPPGIEVPSPPAGPRRERGVPLEMLQRLQPEPTWLGNPSANPSLRRDQEGLRLGVPEAGRGMKWSLRLDPPWSLQETPFLLLEYQAQRVHPSTDYFLYLAPQQPQRPQPAYHAITLGDLVPDGKRHRLVARVPEEALAGLSTLAFQVQAEQANAEVLLRSLSFLSHPPEPEGTLADLLPSPSIVPLLRPTLSMFDLGARYNGSLRQILAEHRLRSYRFSQAEVVVAGVPFRVSTEERNVALVPGPLGTLRIPLGARGREAKEAYLLLAASFPRYDEPSCGGGRLWRIEHPYRFVVEVVYTDGSTTRFFPLRLLSQEPEIASGLDVYGVPLEKPTREIRLHDRMRLGEFGLCGLTLHRGPRRFDDSRWLVEKPSSRAFSRATDLPLAPQSVGSQGDRFELRSGPMRWVLDARRLLWLECWLELPVGKVQILHRPAPLFTLQTGEGPSRSTRTSSDYRMRQVEADGKTVRLHLQPPPDCEGPEVLWEARVGDTGSFDGSQGGQRWPALEWRLTLRNAGKKPLRPLIAFPAALAQRLSEFDLFFYPYRVPVISGGERNFRHRYGGNLPLPFFDVSGRRPPFWGMGFLVKEEEGLEWFLSLQRGRGTSLWEVEWRCDPILPGGELRLSPVEIFLHPGDWRAAFQRYRAWVRTWYRPLAPRKGWFRRVFAFRQDYIGGGLYDFEAARYRFADRIEHARQVFGRCDYLHIFDWGSTRDRGRTGDYDPWGNRIPGPEAFRKAVEEVQREVPVGLYIEGYLVDERSRVGRAHREDWGLRNPDGKVQLWEPGSPEFVMCPGVEGWQNYLASTYRRVQEETGALGFYIDEFGFTSRDCYASNHGHPPGWNVLRGERELTRKVREALPPECVVYTENFPPDRHTLLQDGAFDYTIYSYQTMARRWTPLPLRLSRFAFPDFKVFQIIVCDRPMGTNEEAVQQVFFNGDGYWLQGEPDSWFQPEVLRMLRKCIGILHRYADAFAGEEAEPVVPTLQPGVFANRFGPVEVGGERLTVWTLYNANFRSISGPVLAVEPRAGARYEDAWHERPLKPGMKNGSLLLSTTLEPHGAGCLVRWEELSGKGSSSQ